MSKEWNTYITVFLIGLIGGFIFSGNMIDPAGAASRQWQAVANAQNWNDPREFSSFDALQIMKGDRVTLLLSALSHENPVVRWYGANKAIEYVASPDAVKLQQALQPLTQDEQLFIREAAVFALSFFEGTYKLHSKVEKAPDGSRYVFTRFHASESDELLLWVVEKGQVSILMQTEGRVRNFFISPDSTAIAITQGGDDWFSLDIMVFSEEVLQQVYPEDGFDVSFIEWSKDSQQVLFYYAFNKTTSERWYGHGVYDLGLEQVLRVTEPVIGTDLIMIDKEALGWK